MYDEELEETIEWKKKQIKDFLELAEALELKKEEIEPKANALLEDLFKLMQKRKK